jgi:sugar phosphate isomerase/epimerase
MNNRTAWAKNALEEHLRKALENADFNEVRRLLPDYSAEIVACLSSSKDTKERQGAIESFQDLLSLARVMRAHLSARLSDAQHQSSYLTFHPSTDKHSWRFEA